ncbi:MAG: hypothetical protein HYV09_19715 [Deltaproteobacteria bacterium]|nr:hypothetical protein [Deltaproteobacteria bacterium]
MIVPAAALGVLAAAAGETATRELGRTLGRSLGARVAERLSASGGHVRDASLEAVLEGLAGELAIVGLGALSMERWGRALLVCVSDAPVEGAIGDALLAAVIEGMLAAASGRELRTLPVAREGARLRVLVANVASIERVGEWLGQGLSWGDALVRLHAPRAEEAS